MKTLVPTTLLAVLAALAVPTLVSAAGTLDEGLLDPSWFGGDLAFRETDEIDYLWVADGLDLAGATIRVAEWEEPSFLGDKRDAKDSAQAVELTDRWPSWLRGAIGSVAGLTASKEGGDYVLEGRIVDCNAGSKAAKWLVGMGAGSATATWDLKLVDAKSGRVVLALHHRAISGTSMSDIDDKIVKWLDEGLVDALSRGVVGVYQGGKAVKE